MLAIAGAAALRAVLEPWLDRTQIWLTFWPAVFVAAWLGGLRAGLVAVGLAVAIVFAWIYPASAYQSLHIGVGAAVFVTCGIAFAWLAELAQRSQREQRLLRIQAEQARADERRLREDTVERETARTRRMRGLNELATVLAATTSVDDVAQAVVSEGMRASSADTCMLYTVDERREHFQLVSERGCAPEVVTTIQRIALASEQGRRLVTEQWVEDAPQYEALMPEVARIESTHPRARSFWSVPLVSEGRPIGVLAMGWFRDQSFPPEEREFVRLFARHCAEAVVRAERTARLEQARVRAERIFDANLIGTVHWHVDGRVLRANDSFLRSIGYTRDELLAGQVDWRALTPPEYAARDREMLAQLAEHGQHEPFEKEYVHKDGHRVPVLVAAAMFADDPRQGVSFVADLTEVKRAADAANRAKDDFLAMLGHELRNPLAPITTAVELLELKGAERGHRAIAIIKRQVQHLTKLVDELLDVARIRSGKITLARQPVEINELVARVLETIGPLVAERQHRVGVDVPTSGLEIDADATRMAQVLGNVIANAAKYTDPGGTIEIAAYRDDGDVVITVRDNGVGIEPEVLPHVFDLFTQEPQNVERSRGGLGLGLSIARTFVTLHGGTIEAHSAGKGQGSTFTIRLPAAASAPIAESAGGGLDVPTRVRRVLVVDDNRDAAEMLTLLAEHRGHLARRASDGPSALRLLEEFVPDVALLDLGLPQMDGFELAQRIRQQPRLARVRLVAVTGHGHPTDRDRSRAAGFDAHLVKPLQVNEIIEAIERDDPKR
ncbi:MAG TPA: ATP-binding protein [Kofleriaceae bacterium]|nr:ATP-binding protein [Kofleriaceae bacterium]